MYTLSTADHDFCDLRPFVRDYFVYDFTSRELFDSPWGRLNQFQRWRDLRDLDKLHYKIAVQVNAKDYDVLFAHPDIFTLIPRLLVYVKIPTLYYLHEPFGPNFVRPQIGGGGWREKVDRFDPLIGLYQRELGKMRAQSVQSTNQLVANSEFTQEVIQKTYALIAPVCHCGVNVDGFRPSEGMTRENFVLSVGELSSRKGFDFIVRSLGQISAKKRPALKLACNKIDQQELKLLQELAIQNVVDLEIHSDLNMDQLRVLYNKARLFVYSPILEPFGLVPLEAMACGTAVVGVKEGGVQESVVHEVTGLLIERDHLKFGEAVLKLLDNPALAEKYGENGRKHVLENWTWEKSVSILTSYLEKCADLA